MTTIDAVTAWRDLADQLTFEQIASLLTGARRDVAHSDYFSPNPALTVPYCLSNASNRGRPNEMA
jgi:hypothetical protein